MSYATVLAESLSAVDSLAIVCHDNPDPDCLASALALDRIASDCGVEDRRIVYGGEVSHQQNRAFVNMLSIDIHHANDVDVTAADCIAFVDHSVPGGNTTVPAHVRPDIVVDHHPTGEVNAPYTDVRSDYGATATIFVEYLSTLEIELDQRLATALLFALHRERLDFVRDPTRAEYEAALAVYERADLEDLHQLYGSAFTPATIEAIGRAIRSRVRHGSVVVANVGQTTETDALPQAADYLLNVEGVNTVLTYGIVEGTVRLSARTNDPRDDVGGTLQEAFGDLGSVGGHHDMAGGRIDLGIFADIDDDADGPALLDVLSHRIESRFFENV